MSKFNRRSMQMAQHPDPTGAAAAMLDALKELLQEANQAGWGEAGYTSKAEAAIAMAEAAGITAGE